VLKNPVAELLRSLQQIECAVVGQMARVMGVPGAQTNTTRRDGKALWDMDLVEVEGCLVVKLRGQIVLPEPLVSALEWRARSCGARAAQFWTMPGFFPGLYAENGLSVEYGTTVTSTARENSTR
jgi:hypothetical protein